MSEAGPFTDRHESEARRRVSRDCGGELPATYVGLLRDHHGSRVEDGGFRSATGELFRLGRWLHFAGDDLPAPAVPDWELNGRDLRAKWYIGFLEATANLEPMFWRGLFPVGALWRNNQHPDVLSPVHLDYVCLRYEPENKEPSVVVWRNDAAQEERLACERRGERPWQAMRTDAFLLPVAATFSEFLSILGR